MFIVIKIKKNIQNFKGFLIKRMRKDKKTIMWSVTETHNQKKVKLICVGGEEALPTSVHDRVPTIVVVAV